MKILIYKGELFKQHEFGMELVEFDASNFTKEDAEDTYTSSKGIDYVYKVADVDSSIYDGFEALAELSQSSADLADANTLDAYGYGLLARVFKAVDEIMTTNNYSYYDYNYCEDVLRRIAILFEEYANAHAEAIEL